MRFKGSAAFFALTALTMTVHAQVLKSNAPTVDSRLATHTAPFSTAVLSSRPTDCTAGDVFFATDATAGQNVFLCTTTGSPGTWTQVVSGGGSGSTGNPLVLTRTSGSVLTLGATCSNTVPCTTGGVGSSYTYNAGALVTLVSGNGTVTAYAGNDGTLYIVKPASGISVSCGTGCTDVTALPGGVEATLLGAWNATGGTWDTNPSQQLAVTTPPSFIQGPNMSIVKSGNSYTFTPSGGSNYDPMDMTTFFTSFAWATVDSTSTIYGNSWHFNGTCVAGGAISDSSGPAGRYFSGADCLTYYGTVSPITNAFADFLSGSTTATSTLKFRAGRTTGTANTYYGWNDNFTSVSGSFVGIKQDNAAGQFKCVIVTGGSVTASANIAASDSSVHTFTVATSAGAASCSVDSTTQPVTGTIPAFTQVLAVGGVDATGSNFQAFENRIQIKGLSR